MPFYARRVAFLYTLTSAAFARFAVNRRNILRVLGKPLLYIVAERLYELDAWWVVIVEGKRSTLLEEREGKKVKKK